VRGDFEATGIRPQVMDLISARGIEVSGLSFAPAKRTL